MRPKPRCCGQPHRRPWRSPAAQKSGAATVEMKETTAAGMAALGVAAAIVVEVVTVGVATPTTAVEESTAAKADEARLVEGVNREAARILDEVIEAVAAALGEAAGDDETVRGVVPLVTLHLSARRPLQVRTPATPRWCPQKGKQLLPGWMLHLRQRV